MWPAIGQEEDPRSPPDAMYGRELVLFEESEASRPSGHTRSHGQGHFNGRDARPTAKKVDDFPLVVVDGEIGDGQWRRLH